MKITVKLFATLQRYGPESREMEIPENTSVNELPKMLDIPDKFTLLRVVNGEHVDADYILKEGDVLALFPPIAGG